MKLPYDGFDASGGDFLAGPDAFLAGGDSAGPFPVTSPPVETPPAATPLSAGATDAHAALATLDSASSAVEPLTTLSILANPGPGDQITSAAAIPGGASAAQLLQALNESGLSVNGTGIKVGVISDSFNDKGGAAADEASGALPSASNIQVLKDLPSGGTDEGRAMMQIVHEIAPGASLAFYTADVSEQDFANGILALAAAGCKVICDDVSYFDEPMFQNGVVAQAIQTVEAEGVTYVAAAANNASNAYQAAWTHSSGASDGLDFTDAESFGGSILQTVTVTASTAHPVPLLLEWDRAYGQANFNSGQPDIDMFVYQNGTLIAQATNVTAGEPNNPFTGVQFTASGTYQIAIVNNFGPDPGTIKEVLFGNGASVSISGANAGTVYGHAMTPGAITAGAVSVASTPAFGVSPALSETFSSSGAGTELLFANDGTRLSSPQSLSPVAVSGVDGIATTVPGGLSDFFGTSAASASLAGVAALILAENPNLTPAQVEQIMEQTASPMANSAVSGAGLVNVDAAVAAAQALLPSIESFGSTKLVEVGSNFFVDPVSGGTGPELKYGGAAFVAGTTWGGWAPIGAEAISGGYEVAFKIGADTYTVWDTDANGNLTTIALGTTSGSNPALEALEVSFQQDLNGDHVIGVPATVIELAGSTSLIKSGGDYFLGTSGPTLKYAGAVVTDSTFPGLTPIGTEATATGFEVVLHDTAAAQYDIWLTDTNGNINAIVANNLPGNSPQLESLETTFQQDLNGDHIIGVPPTVIELAGSTSLIKSGGDYFLGTSGPTLKYAGAVVTDSTFPGLTPIGTEATASGFEVVLHDTAAAQYDIWLTDTNGNINAIVANNLPGNSLQLESLETTFQQDLNGDHTIGVPATVIELAGSTSLIESGGDYFLGTSGPTLKYAGAVVTDGTFPGLTPIGTEATATGFEVVLHDTAAAQYDIWLTDTNGNINAIVANNLPGNSLQLESLETTFQQDLNGDHIIGVPGHTSPSAQVASIAPPAPASFTGSDAFAFRPDLGGGTQSNSVIATALQQAGELIASTATHMGAELQQILATYVQDVIGPHDGTSHGPLFDPGHGFIIH